MAIKPWMTSSDLIESVKRKIAIPINQRTFSEEDILAFGNEEMMISQVPDILVYHEEYFVQKEDVPLVNGQRNYPIPERALGQKLRDVFYKDSNNNLFEMVRVNPNDRSYWQGESNSTNYFQKYYLEGNDIVLAPINVSVVTGKLQMTYFLRPNQLVPNAKAAISKYFLKDIEIDNTTLVVGDTFTISDTVFTVVAGSPGNNEFEIGATSIDTATNLVNAINANVGFLSVNGTPSTSTVTVKYLARDLAFETSNEVAFVISTDMGIEFIDNLPVNIVDGINVDFLQTKGGHKTLAMSIPLPLGSTSTNSITFAEGIIPESFVIGDYICEEYECIIPQIPSDLHNGLAERICGRILSAQGDMAGYQLSGSKLLDIKKSEGELLDNRVEGSTQKIIQRKSLLAFMSMGFRRRL